MKFDTLRCVECNDLLREAYKPDSRFPWDFLYDGKIVPDDPFRFCSDECAYDAMKTRLPELLPQDSQHPEVRPVIQKHLQQYRARWYAEVGHRKQNEEAKQRQKEKEAQREQERLRELIKPRPIPEHLRFHTAVIAKTRWGKTQLLQATILEQLKKTDPPSMVVLDSTGAMVGLIQRLAVFNGPLRDRLVIIDPARPPALNMFDIWSPRFDKYSEEQREALQTDIIALFNYIFESEDYDLTGQMGLAFACAVRVILERRNSTLTDLRRLLQENITRGQTWTDSDFIKDIQKLDEDTQEFFEKQYYLDTLKATRDSIARRVYTLTTTIPAFRRMFSAEKNSLDMYAKTQDEGAIILVNTSEQLLKGGSVLFGRFVIARLMASIFERGAIPRDRRRPTELIIDEAAPYFDQSFDKLLSRVAQYGLKVTIAFQHFDQLGDTLKNAVAGQTSVKYLGGLSYEDARMMAREIRCAPEFLQDLKTDISDPPQWSEFAVHVDNFTPHPMKLRLPFYAVEQQPQMTDNEHKALLERKLPALAAIDPDTRSQEPIIEKPASQAGREDEPTDEAAKW